MDYDDNDFQGHNLHLAGEGSSNFPPVLNPYSLPKFDFDDSLQGHLRFDSLVENEVFLGIPTQEDNQWIEDFSRGSSRIEFSSSAAESHSISRHNNVWSEATSSESVEMLLKSVGETIIEESDACDELVRLTEQMESNSKQGDGHKDIMDLHPSTPPVECAEQFSGLNESAEPMCLVEGTLQTQEKLIAYDAVSERSGLLVANNAEIDRESNENHSNVDISADESLDDIMHKDPSVSGGQIDNKLSLDTIACVTELDNREIPKQVSDINAESASGIAKDIGIAVEEDHAMRKGGEADDHNLKETEVESGICNLGSSLGIAPIVECTDEHALETNSITCEEPSSSALDSKCEAVVSFKSTELLEPNKDNLHKESTVAVFQGDANTKGHNVEVSNVQYGCARSEIGSPIQIMHGQSSSIDKEENFPVSDLQFDSEASVSKSEASLASNNQVGDLPKLTAACISTELPRNATDNLDGVNDASGIKKKDPNAEDHAFISISPGSVQICKADLVSKEGDNQNLQNVAFNVKRNEKGSSDSRNSDNETIGPLITDKSVESTSSVEDTKEKDMMSHELGNDTSARDEPAPPTLENTKHHSPDGVPFPSSSTAIAGEASDQSEEQKSTVLVGVVMDFHKKEETEVVVPIEGSLPTLLQGRSELGSVSAFEKVACADSAGQLAQSIVDQSVAEVQTCNAASRSEQGMVSAEVSQEDSKNSEVSPVHCGSTVKDDSGEELVVLANRDEAMVEKDHGVLSSEVFVDFAVDSSNNSQGPSGLGGLSECNANRALDGGGRSSGSEKPDCGSPIVISSAKKDGQVEVKRTVDECIPVSGITVGDGNKVLCTSQDLIEGDVGKDQKSFTFEVSPLAGHSGSDTSKSWQSLPTIQGCEISTIAEGSPSTSGAGQLGSKKASKISRRSPLATDGKTPGGSKGSTERKPRRVSGNATRKENTKKGNQTTTAKPQQRGDEACNVSMCPSATGQLEGLKPCGNVEPIGTKPFGVIAIPTSNLPDLNSSTPPSALFQQSFTDLQQVQLRAQIFVYGSLIQVTAPDEACMISAFGSADGGRSVWEPTWRACVERIQCQKSHSNNVESPLQSRSGARVADQSAKQAPLQNKVLPSPVSRVGGKSTPPSPVVNSMIPLSSPLWNMSTASSDVGLVRGPVLDYHQALSSLHSYQTPPTRNYVGHSTPWLSQSPFPGAWLASPQTSTFDAGSRFSMLPITESVKLTPIKESSVPVSSGIKHVSPSPVHSGVPSVFSSPIGVKKVTQSPGQNFTEPKSRKRKKVPVAVDLGPISLPSQSPTQSVSTPVVTGHLSTSVIVSTPAFIAPKSNIGKIVEAVLPVSSADDSKRSDQNAEKKLVIAEDTSNTVEEAKVQAEEAATLASAAVNQSQIVWSRLDKQKKSGSISDIEAKLASAAVTIAAAAAVAKAAAAAAKIASNAALQAKTMADEALGLSGSCNSTQSTGVPTSDVVNNSGIATNASSIIVAAREAARRRVEATTAASKHAENLDAIVKAAELAAEAVTQVGKVVAMGDPLALSELVKAGPEGYWKVPEVISEHGEKSNIMSKEQSNMDRVEEGHDVFAKHSMETTNHVMPRHSREISGVADGISGSLTSSEKDLIVQRGLRASDLAKTIGVIPESEMGPRFALTVEDGFEKMAGTSIENNIKEGCLVEVFKDGDDTKAAWFSAKVLSLKDGNVLVCYTELHSAEGSGLLTEWVALEGQPAPRIRIAHPLTTTRFEGTRKRRRSAMGDYAWSVGDRVDAWVDNCWREGVVKEKSAKDETTLTVRFPAEGETSLVRAWHLRPTRIWNDREWIEWSSSREKKRPFQGDTPQEKRLKLGGPDVEGKVENMPKNVDPVESEKPENSHLLPLSANEISFNVGKQTSDENKPDRLGTTRTDLHKEGSKVIFGVPKPGKKRKFMEVSKHYVAEKKHKNTEATDSVKFAKYLMPQGSGPRGSKNNSKVDFKEKTAAESKSKVLKPGKPQVGFGRNVPLKDKISSSVVSSSNVGTAKSIDINKSRQEFGSLSNTEGVAEGPMVFSSQALPSDARSKMLASKAKSERLNKGRPAPSGGRSSRPEVKDKVYSRNPEKSTSEKSISEVMEPRRSNRRIQPTSRLLEGLQSSLTVSKNPPLHEKTHKTQSRGTSKGNSNG